MKKFIAILLTLAMSASLVACSSPKKDDASNAGKAPANKLEEIKANGYITVALSPDFGPYEFVDLNKTGQDSVVGCEVELAKYIAEYLGVELKIEQMEFSTCQAAVSSGNVDFSVSGYAKTPDREKNMECSEFYTWGNDDESGQGVIVLKENKDLYKEAKDFDGKIIGAQNGSLQQNLVTAQLPANVTMEPISAITDGVMMLLTGKIDGLASSYDTGLQYCKNYDKLSMAPFKFEYESDGNIALVKKG
ncbi:MAG: transporter substrate-binding domain-containing protein, partial [Oscillospiraceae bacterium]